MQNFQEILWDWHGFSHHVVTLVWPPWLYAVVDDFCMVRDMLNAVMRLLNVVVFSQMFCNCKRMLLLEKMLFFPNTDIWWYLMVKQRVSRNDSKELYNRMIRTTRTTTITVPMPASWSCVAPAIGYPDKSGPCWKRKTNKNWLSFRSQDVLRFQIFRGMFINCVRSF